MQKSSVTSESAAETPTQDWGDDLLLVAIAEGSGEAAVKHRRSAEAAFRVFMDRWGRPMETAAKQLCAFPPALYIGADAVLSELWQKVYFRAETFKDGELVGEQLQRRVAGWLKTIARNVLRDLLDEYDKRKLCEIPDEELPAIAERDPADLFDEGASQPAIENKRLAAVAGCLQKLTEREIDVLRTTAEYFNADCETDSMPKHLRDALCARYQIPPATLRQVRKRALDKLKKCAGPKVAMLEQVE